MQENYQAIISSPIGYLGIQTTAEKLSRVDFLPDNVATFSDNDLFTQNIIHQLNNYFVNPNFIFTLPIIFSGTELQKQIWNLLRQIPLGKTATYGALAKQLQTNPRVIGNACRRNPIPVIVPCHRAVAANHLGGFGGEREGEFLRKKEWLLSHEMA